MNRYLVYQAHGRQEVYDELCFSIYSLLNLYEEKPPFDIIIYSDNIPYLSELLPKWIIYKLVDKQKITEWAGKKSFVHRVKIMVLLDVMNNFEGSILYSDTDTYFIEPIERIFGWIESDNYVVHIKELPINSKSNPLYKKLEYFLKQNKQFGIPATQVMYNAGVLGFMTKDYTVIEGALKLTDSLYEAFPTHVTEQLAFSYLLQKNRTIKEANRSVYHYWNFKEFRKVLREFFDIYKGKSYLELRDKVYQINPIELHKPKLHYESLAFWPKAYRKFINKRWVMPPYDFK